MKRRIPLVIGVALLALAGFIDTFSLAWAQGSEPITPDNADRVEQLAMLGRGTISDLAWSPDGKTLAVASFVGVWLYDPAALDAPPRLLAGDPGSAWSVAFSPDGTMLASGSEDRTVRLWDAATGSQVAILQGHFVEEVMSVAFSPDGTMLASGGAQGDGRVRLWDVATGQERAALQGPIYFVWSVAFSPDGATLVSGGDSTVRLWDVATGQERAVLRSGAIYATPDAAGNVSSNMVNSVAFSPDGATVASGGGDGTVRLWDVATGQERAVLEGHTSEVQSVAFSPDGATLVSAGGLWDYTIRLWDVAAGQERAVLQASGGSLAFSLDGTLLASGSGDGTIRLWGVPTAP